MAQGGKTYPGSPKRDGRQIVETRADHSNGMVSVDRHFPEIMLTMASAPGGSLCHQVQPQTIPIRKPSPGSQCLGSGCPKPVLGGSGPLCLSPDSPIGSRDVKTETLPVQMDHPDRPRLAQNDLVVGPGGDLYATVALCLPLVANLLMQWFNRFLYGSLTGTCRISDQGFSEAVAA